MTAGSPSAPAAGGPAGDLEAGPGGEVGEVGDTREASSPARAGERRWWERTGVLVATLTGVVAVVPLAVALGVLRSPRWHPVLDLAQTELRVRDVGTGDSPLVGLPGRFNAFGQQGSHLGPISFYALWPVYVLLGAGAWALQVSAVALNVLATGAAVWIGRRRGGTALALGVAAALAVLLRAYGAERLTEAWNPYMPVLWWVVFLLAVWSVMCEDLPVLPVAVVAATFCMQTHIPYLGMVGGVAGFLVLATAVAVVRRWREGRLGGDERRRLAGWSGASLVLLVALWTPPIVDEITGDPGNMSVVRESLSTSEESTPGAGEVVSVWLGHLDVRQLVTGWELDLDVNHAVLPGALLLGVWLAAAAATAWDRRRGVHDPRLARLHVLVGVALALGLISIGRVQGAIWSYLLLWAWGTTVLVLVAVGWTAVDRLRRSRDPGARAQRMALAGLAAGTVLVASAFAVEATGTEMPSEVEASMVAQLAPPTIEALESGGMDGTGESGRYLMWWESASDELGLGGQAYGMFLELERAGFDVGAGPHHETGVAPHRVREPAEATAVVHHVVGPQIIERWRATPEATLVAEADLRTDEEVARYRELRDEVVVELRAAGEPELADRVDTNLITTALAETLPPELEPELDEMLELGLPAAVFVTPPDVLQPTG